MVQIKAVDRLHCADACIKPQQSIYTFTQRYPCSEDADHRSQIYVYKPPGWPEELQPQYKNAPSHILSIDGYWTKVKWNRLNQFSYHHPNWKKRLLFTHWKPITKPFDGFVFESDDELHPCVPNDLNWDSFDWSEVRVTVEQAILLMLDGVYAERQEVERIHQALLRLLEIDDPFFLNQWVPAIRQFNWWQDCDLK